MLGQVIHGYRIDQALSEDKGGFGDVYFATHVDSGAEAVVKVLKPEMSAQRDIVARFFNEARAAASVHHPGVVQIHNVGYHGDRAYLLMERLRGQDLEGRLAAGPLPVDRAVLFVRQAAGAVGAAHDRGIVHRDLKPANLFVVADPDVVGGERVKVLDFGIAKLTADAGAGKTQGVFGTPAYMSPEQCASTGAVDGRADLYSLGCIFYELVCGRPPFGQGGIELIASHLRDTPPPPRAIAPWLPPPIEQVILRLLEKQPGQRYPTCAALIAALDEAAAASGLAGASSAGLPASGVTGRPPFATPTTPLPGAPYSTTLGAAAGAATVPPAARRGAGLWIGLGAVAVVAAIVVVLAMPGHRAREPEAGSGSGSAGSGSSAGSGGSSAGSGSAVAMVADAGTGAPDATGSLTDDAERLDAEGRHYMDAQNFEPARQRFSQAIAMAPLAKYYVDLAKADIALGHLVAATAVLREVRNHSPTPGDLGATADQLFFVAQEARAKGIAIAPPITDAESHLQPRDLQTPPSTEGQQAILAAKLNDEGKNLLLADHYDQAAKKFEEAVARDPLAKYFVNLCVAKLQLGYLDEALVACNAVAKSDPTADQQRRAAWLIGKIRDEATRQGLQLHE